MRSKRDDRIAKFLGRGGKSQALLFQLRCIDKNAVEFQFCKNIDQWHFDVSVQSTKSIRINSIGQDLIETQSDIRIFRCIWRSKSDRNLIECSLKITAANQILDWNARVIKLRLCKRIKRMTHARCVDNIRRNHGIAYKTTNDDTVTP